MNRFIRNSKKDSKIANFPQSVVVNSGIEQRCKFNFSYFDSNAPSSEFLALGIENLSDLMIKLKEFTKVPLTSWIEPCKKHNSLLEIYGNFPPSNKTKFTYPSHVPADVKWGRFRLSGEVRLIGFTIPDELHNRPSKDGNQNSFLFDKNTFYVVFLDLNHEFWISEKKHT